MGRQVNFYMHPDDLSAFQAEIDRRGDVSIFASRSSGSTPTRLGDAVVTKYGQEDLTVFLARSSDCTDIQTAPVPGRADVFYLDAARSPVLEFSRCYCTPDLIRRGRLWVSTGQWSSKGDWMPGDKQFLSWADSWIRWIRRHYQRLEVGDYIGSQAAAWANVSGHQLEAT